MSHVDGKRDSLPPRNVLQVCLHDQPITRRDRDGFLNVLTVVLDLIEAHLSEIDVCGHTDAANRDKFAAEVEKELGVSVDAMITGELVAERADILVAATNSVSRVVPPEWLKPGVHVTCVKITELGEETLRKVDRLVIHTRKWAPDNYITGFNDEKVEAHDPIDLLTEGAKAPSVAPKQPFWLGAPELKDVIAGKLPGRQSAKEITCFNNNIGLGIQFAALGKAIFDDAKAKGLGREIPTDWFLETVHP